VKVVGSYMEEIINTILHGDAREKLKELDECSVNCCVTSPPYWGLRNYGNEDQIGLESTPEEYVSNIVDIFKEVKRVLKDEGTLWLNIGDSYASGGMSNPSDKSTLGGGKDLGADNYSINRSPSEGLKQKDLVGIPWRVAFALQKDGWYLRNDIIWYKCLSGGTNLYAKTQKGIITSKLKDLARLKLDTVKLWDGEKWNQVVDFVPQEREEQPIEITLRSGERINCTPEHKFPTESGIKKAKNLSEGDVLQSAKLPNNKEGKAIDEDIGWLVGYYLAEGSRDDRNNLQFSSHENEEFLHQRLDEIANKYYGKIRHHSLQGKSYTSIMSGNFLKGAIDDFIRGDNAKNKGLTNKVWRQSDKFLNALLNGYLMGDGHYDGGNERYRISFTRNYRLEKDMRTLCARLNYQLRLKPVTAKNQDGEYKAFRGEIRFITGNHHNQKSDNEVVKIGNSRSRKFWDVVLEDKPHVFALGSGVLSHNSNPMPESVKDRCTTSHEHIFLLAKSKQYYYDQDAIREPHKEESLKRYNYGLHLKAPKDGFNKGGSDTGAFKCERMGDHIDHSGRNKRDVWEVPTKGFPEAHFAVYPPDLIRPCIKAGCPDDGIVLDPFTGAGTTALVSLQERKNFIGIEINKEYIDIAYKRISNYGKKYYDKVSDGNYISLDRGK